MKHIPLIGRILLAQVFIIYGLIKAADFERFWHVLEIEYGIPMAPMVTILIVGIEIVGGFAILFGFQTRIFSGILFVYLFIQTCIQFPIWSDFLGNYDDFIRNLAIMGGLLIEEYAGAGPESVDESHVFDT